MKRRVYKKRLSRQKREAKRWMRRYKGMYDRAFDMAVDCAHDLELVSAEYQWEIPDYVVTLAETFYPEEDV